MQKLDIRGSNSNFVIKSIDGPELYDEGFLAGTSVIRLNFAHCNKWSGKEEDREYSVCNFCDSDFVGGTSMSIREIIAELNQMAPCKTVVLGGGEPTLQLTPDLLSYIGAQGFKLILETNGSRRIGSLFMYLDHTILSPKQRVEDTQLEGCTELRLMFPYIAEGMGIDEWENFPARHRYLSPIRPFKDWTGINAKVHMNPHWRVSFQEGK